MRKSIKKMAALLVASVIVMGSTMSTMAAAPHSLEWIVNIYERESYQKTIRLVSSGPGTPCQVSCTRFTRDSLKKPYVTFSSSNLNDQMNITGHGNDTATKKVGTTGYEFDVTYKNVFNYRLYASGTISA